MIHQQAVPPSLENVLRSAADLQRVVPEAVLVGGTAAAVHAGHRISLDHDHVLTDLASRYEEVLEAVEATDGWITNVRASAPPLTLLGSLGGIEAGLRQLRRTRQLEVEEVTLGTETTVRVPTLPEMLRVKSYLVVQRNHVRDYLDTVALAATLGRPRSAEVLVGLDDYYQDRSAISDSVLTALIQRLSEPEPRDRRVTRELRSYKGIDSRWQDWSAVVTDCHRLADDVLELLESRSAP